MTAYRAALTPEQQARYDEAAAEAGAVLAAACRDRDLLAAASGTGAVAEAARYPGHRMTADEIQAYYEQLQDQARRKGAAA